MPRVPTPPATFAPPSGAPAWPGAIGGVLIFVGACIAYGPALTGAWLWDDAGHLTAPELRSLAGLARIWLEPGATQQYYPVLHSAFWLEHRLWGDAVLGYHVVNVLLHATAACLLAAVVRRLGHPGAAWWAALLFALHPVAAESVAWIAEQKNTLSAVLALAAALAYLRFDAAPDWRRYAVATALFAAALLAKTVTATLPAALLVILWWIRGRVGWRREVRWLLPWLALGAAAGLFTAAFERTSIGAQGSEFALGPLERVLLAARVPWFYLGKLLWPASLSFNYPRWTIDAGDAVQWLFLAATAGALGWAAMRTRQGRGPLAGLLLFGGMLFPVLGFVDVYPFLFSYVADHFQYHAAMAVFAAAGLALQRLPAAMATGTAVATALALGAMTHAQAASYRDVFALYRTTLARNPHSWLAHNNLGSALVEAGRPAEAERHFRRALELRPIFPEADNNLGDCLTRLGRAADAIPHLERALRLQPRYAEACNNLGSALMAVGRAEEGRARFAEAIGFEPGLAVAHFNLGLATASAGRPAEAVAHFREAVRRRPDYAEAELNWAVALTLTDRPTEAEPHFERALALAPDSVPAHALYGRALARAGRFEAAIARYRRALELAPGDRQATLELAQLLRQTGRGAEAEAHLREAGRPGLPP